MLFGIAADAIFYLDKRNCSDLRRRMTFLKDWQYALVNVYITMENHHFQWVNPLFLWPFSIATLNYQRVDYRNDGLLYDQSGPNHTGGRICGRMNIHCWSCTFTRVTSTRMYQVLGFRWIYPHIPGVGNCPHFGYIGHHLIIAIIDHIPNGWVMFNGDI